MPWQVPAKRFGGPKGRSWTNKAIAKTRLASRKTKLTSATGVDHRTTAKGGGIDLQATRARLTQLLPWTVTGAQQLVVNRRPDPALEWATYATIYDQFKVNSMKITICFPKYIVANATSCTGVAAQPMSVWPEVVGMAYDNDSISVPASFASLMGYSTYKEAACDGLVSYNLPTLPKGATYGASALGYINSSEWQDVASPAALAGTTTLWLNKLPYVLPAGQGFQVDVHVEWDVTFKGKRN